MYILKMLAAGLVLFVFWMQILIYFFGRFFEVASTGPDNFFTGIASLITMVPVAVVLVAINLFIISRFSHLPFRYVFLVVVCIFLSLNAFLFLPDYFRSSSSLKKEREWIKINDQLFYELTQIQANARFENGKWNEDGIGDIKGLAQLKLDQQDVSIHSEQNLGPSLFLHADFPKRGVRMKSFLSPQQQNQFCFQI